MLTHPTLDQLKALKLDGMAEAFVELRSARASRAISRTPNGWRCCSTARRPIATPGASKPGCAAPSCATAKPRSRTSTTARHDGSTKRCSSSWPTGRWIAEHRNLLVTGPCGVGKSWLSCALAQKACRDGYTVHYARVPRLFADLELAHGDGRFTRLFRTLVKVDLLDPRRLGA